MVLGSWVCSESGGLTCDLHRSLQSYMERLEGMEEEALPHPGREFLSAGSVGSWVTGYYLLCLAGSGARSLQIKGRRHWPACGEIRKLLGASLERPVYLLLAK